MVLWEITLGTAYFLGLKRSYRLALKLQRRLISPNRPRVRQFVYRRIRTVFDIAFRVHQNIQQRDIEVGRNLGNWILRHLDRMKPTAQIRGDPPRKPPTGGSAAKQVTNSTGQQPPGSIQRFSSRIVNREIDGHRFTSSMKIWPKSFPTLATMMLPSKPTALNVQYRNLCISGPYMPKVNNGKGRFEGVIRKDIMQWMLQ